MGTVTQDTQGGKTERTQRWDRMQCAERLDVYRDLLAQGVSPRQAAQVLDVSRTTLPAWRVWQDRREAWPRVVAFLESGPGLAFLHRRVVALPMVFVEMGACGIRLVCRFLERTALNRFVGAAYGTPQQVNRQGPEAIVAYQREATARLAQRMPPQESMGTQDETLTGGLCLVALEPVSNYSLLEQVAEARDHDTWHAGMAGARAPLKGAVMPATSDEAPGLL
jgi:hypothetical protein